MQADTSDSDTQGWAPVNPLPVYPDFALPASTPNDDAVQAARELARSGIPVTEASIHAWIGIVWRQIAAELAELKHQWQTAEAESRELMAQIEQFSIASPTAD